MQIHPNAGSVSDPGKCPAVQHPGADLESCRTKQGTDPLPIICRVRPDELNDLLGIMDYSQTKCMGSALTFRPDASRLQCAQDSPLTFTQGLPGFHCRCGTL
jgi:hypothetical protein